MEITGRSVAEVLGLADCASGCVDRRGNPALGADFSVVGGIFLGRPFWRRELRIPAGVVIFLNREKDRCSRDQSLGPLGNTWV